MREFNLICKRIRTAGLAELRCDFSEKSAKILPALKNITKDGLTGAAIYSTFILGAIVADGRISEEEYALCYPLLRAFSEKKSITTTLKSRETFKDGKQRTKKKRRRKWLISWANSTTN